MGYLTARLPVYRGGLPCLSKEGYPWTLCCVTGSTKASRRPSSFPALDLDTELGPE